ncbi:hypothetical protein F5Y16DRAFT_355129 [Xylariaceae sp. FL0255]|nr:hypothetical protein F5Y16DRAFT_355129 [Xylariaceae sp. FL0255]
MDPASLDPRLREDGGQDSIVVHHSESDVSDSPHETPSNTEPVFRPQIHDPNDPKRPRACEACRGLKVKCEPEPSNPDGPCKRCTKAGRECIVTQPTRKRQKKTDSRVAELEKKIDALTASLQATRGPPSSTSAALDPTEYQSNVAKTWGPPQGVVHADFDEPYPNQDRNSKTAYEPPLVMAGQKRKFSSETAARSPSNDPVMSKIPNFNHQHSDVVDRNIISMDEATALFQRYTDSMAMHLPAVIFPPGTTAAEVRKSKPVLFLAVMAVASSESPNLQRLLVKELMQVFADKVFLTAEKSLEIVQALIISVIWYFPPEHFEELKFYQMVHTAVVMAIDIGLGRRKNNPKSRLVPYTWRDHPFRRNALPDPCSIESCRTWLGCYFLASNVAMALHRANLLRWQPFMNECVDILETSPDAVSTDRTLCHLVWTHRLGEEVGVQFSMDDPGVFVNITDQKVQYALRGYEQSLEKYREAIPAEDKQPSLMLGLHVLNLYMHEIALHVDKNSEDNRLPANADALRDPIPTLGEGLTSAHISALSACLTAIDGIIETFLSLSVPNIRCLPIFNFVRVAYAVVVLIKVYFSASSPNSELGKVIDKDNMKVAEYLDRLLERFRETATSDKSRPAGKFLVVLIMLRGWFNKQNQKVAQSDEQIDPALRQQSNTTPTTSGVAPFKSRETGPHLDLPNEQRQQPSQQPEYNPANTPLQLLSEIATGNGDLSRNGQPVNSNMNTPTPAYPSWMGSQIMYDPATGTPTSVPGGDPAVSQPIIPWMNAAFGLDFDYSSMGDGFEEAMGLTMSGFGGGWSGDMNLEHSLRMMTENDPVTFSNMVNGFNQAFTNSYGYS